VTILQALDRYYDRMAARGEAEAPGWSREKISFALVLAVDGTPVDKLDLRVIPAGKKGGKPVPRLLEVPASVKRTAGIAPNLLWDKSAYVLGRTAGEGKRTAEEHAAFKSATLKLIEGSEDAGLVALRRFLESWTPDRFDTPPFTAEMLDANIVFQLDGDTGYVHDRPAARRLIADQVSGDAVRAVCLVTGLEAPVERLHPTIKGVNGAQSSGAALISFNLDAFSSYGKEQGDNAPTSRSAAFRYGAALNRMLDRGSRNRLARPIGDATLVFWADASAEEASLAAEDWFDQLVNPVGEAGPENLADDRAEAAKLRDALAIVAEGRPLRDLDPRLSDGVRFHILGLSPNAARLSVRYWMEDRFEVFARRLAEHFSDLSIDPTPWRAKPPSVSRLLVKTTAAQEKFDNIPPLLAGEVTRAILTGSAYPRTLLSTAVMRLRAGDDASTGWHAAAIRAVLTREYRLHRKTKEIPMSLDRQNPDPAYQLGRMFAALETAQRLALGKVNATIRDRYFGAASTTPATMFPVLLRGAQNHFGKLRKEGKGGWLEREIEEIFSHLPASLPRSLRLEAQGRFAIGYYHQRSARFAGRPEEDQETGDDTNVE
jgi:CRISPR-associated protein Csd1